LWQRHGAPHFHCLFLDGVTLIAAKTPCERAEAILVEI
jgi:hypothetical protein